MKRLLFAALALLALTGPGRAADEHLVIRDAIADFVARTGHQIVGIGSWVDGKGYKPGISDHDFRLYIDGKVDPAEAQKIWVQARGELKAAIEKAYQGRSGLSVDIDTLMAKTNFYPPDQMMNGIPDMEQAWVRFKAADAFPNLAAQADRAKIEAAEGLYGDGAKIWRQQYEGKAGAWFYRTEDSAGKAMVAEAPAEAIHRAEGIATQSMAGRANTAIQWVEHGWDEMRHGADGKTMGKYLQRMGVDVDEAIALGRLGQRPEWIAEAKALGRFLQTHPDSWPRYESRVRELMDQGRREAVIVGEIAGANAVKRPFLKALRASCGTGGTRCLLDRLVQHAAAAGKVISMGQALELASFAMDAHSIQGAENDQKKAEAIYSALTWTAGWPIGLLGTATDMARTEAEAMGVATVAQFQDVWDMMNGDFSATGRAGTSTIQWPLERLVRDIHDEDRLSLRVQHMATLASRRGFGRLTGERDQALADRLYEQAWPVVVQAWTERRQAIETGILAAMQDLARHPVRLTYRPNPAIIDRKTGRPGEWQPLQVAVALDTRDGRIKTALDKIRALMELAGETHDGAAKVTLKWQGGEYGASATQRLFTFEKPGTYTVKATLRVDSRPRRFPLDGMIDHRISIPVAIAVPVIPPEANLGGTRTARFEIHRPPKMVHDCLKVFDYVLEFTFPVDGGPITGFKRESFNRFGFGKDDTFDSYYCITNGGKSTSFEGRFSGGDGGKLTVTFKYTDLDGDTETRRMAGVLNADGTGKVWDPESPDDSSRDVTFEPF